MVFAQVPAPAKAPRDMLQSPEFLIAMGVLVACLFLGAAAIHFVDRWRKRGQAHSRFAGTLQLSEPIARWTADAAHSQRWAY